MNEKLCLLATAEDFKTFQAKSCAGTMNNLNHTSLDFHTINQDSCATETFEKLCYRPYNNNNYEYLIY
jgi:hypothetical protein